MGDSALPPRAARLSASDLRVVALTPPGGAAEDVAAILGNGGLRWRAAPAPEGVADDTGDADAVVIDGTGGPARTLRLVRDVRAAHADVAIVVLVRTASPRELRKLLASGADGIATMGGEPNVLSATILAACSGQVVFPRELWHRAAKPQLSTREKQVLAMVVMGFSNGEIARKLFVTEATVKSHLSSAFSKLGVHSRTEATALILDPDHGLGTGILAISEGTA